MRPSKGWSRRFFQFWSTRTAITAALAAVVGAASGLGAVSLLKFIDLCQTLFFTEGSRAFSSLSSYYIILLPIIGGIIVGPLVYFLAPEAKGHGVTEVMTAMETEGGRIRPVVILVKVVASALTIGSGGSAGPEGPAVQIGAGIGSVLGQRLKLDRRRILSLIAAGAAGGIAATFNAPIAGVMFTLEVLVGEFSAASGGGMVFASVSAAVVSRRLLGDHPAFQIPPYTVVSNWELLLYVGLGVVAAFVALLFVRSLYFADDVFDRWTIPAWLKAPVAGAAVGLIGFLLPQALGTGFTAMDQVLKGDFAFWLVVALIFARIIATSLTLSSGFSGGVFAPTLFVGAMLGSTYGRIVHHFFPSATASSGAYATVGMAAVFAGAARAPVTAIVLIFEMTLDYKIMLPLMFATVVSTLIAARFEPESIYTLQLVQRGIDFLGRGGTRELEAPAVGQIMTPLSESDFVSPDATLTELRSQLQSSNHWGAIMSKGSGKVEGVVTVSDLERALVMGNVASRVSDIATVDLVTAYPDETLDELIRRGGALEIGYIPVVTRANPDQPVGVLLRDDIIRAYAGAVSQRDKRFLDFEQKRARSSFGLLPLELTMDEGDPGVGKTLREIQPPAETIITSITRGDMVMIPRGDTRLRVGDRVAALGLGDGNHVLGRLLKGKGYR